MIYDSYKKRITILARAVAFVRRYRILIACILSVITATAFTITGIGGSLSGVKGCPSEITYGEEYTFEAKAFMTDVSYEYRLEGSDTWTDGLPEFAGEYKVRAYTKNGLGMKRTSNEFPILIKPKAVTFTISEDVIAYGDNPTITLAEDSALVGEDTYTCSEYEFDGIGTLSVSARPEVNSIKIQRGDLDLTYCYDISSTFKDVEITKRVLKLTMDSDTRVYDGTPLSISTYETNDGELLSGDVLTLNATDSITNVGKIYNTASVLSIINQDGDDVTVHYEVQITSGSLEITPRHIKIHTTSEEKWYDSKPLTYDGYTLDDETPLAPNQTIDYTGATITDAGSILIANNTTFKIFDAEGESVESNYTYEFIEESTLTINKVDIAFTSESDGRMYNGEYLRKEAVSISGGALVDGESVVASFTGSIKNVGTTTNAFSVKILKADGVTDSTDNYNITLINGELKVTVRPIKITTNTYSWVYSGKEMGDQAQYGNDNLIEVDDQFYLLAGGDTLVMASNTKVDLVSSVPYDNKLTFKVMCDEEDVTGNYIIEYDYGTISVTPRHIKISSKGISKVYTGYPVKAEDLSVSCDYGENAIVGLDSLEVKYLKEIINVGSIYNEFTYKITRDNGTTDVTQNYVVETEFGILTVTPRIIEIKADSLTKEYDGSYLTCGKASIRLISPEDGYPAISDRDKISFTMTDDSKILDVGVVPNKVDVDSIKIVNADGEDVKGNYQIRYVLEGTLEVTQRPITIKPADLWKYYDGTPLKNTENAYIVVKGSIVSGEKCEITTSASITNYGSIKYDAETVTILRNGQDITGNYSITKEKGTLTIEKRKIVVVTASDEWVYDGEEHFNTDFIVKDDPDNPNDYLAPNQQAKLYGSSYTTVFEVTKGTENKFIVHVYANGTDVSINYEITYENGTLVVKPRPITITSGSASKIYDGTPLTCHQSTIESGVSGEEAIVDCDRVYITYTGSITDIGKQDNTFNVVIRRRSTGKDVTTNYDITKIYGTLEIIPSEIKVKTENQSWVYDGTWHSHQVYSIDPDIRAMSFDVVVTEYAKIKNVGNIENKIIIRIYKNGKDVTDSFIILYDYGTLEVTPRKIIATAGSDEKVYDGTPLTCNRVIFSWQSIEDSIPGEDALVENHTYTATLQGSIYKVGQTPNKILSLTIFDEYGENVTANYDVIYEDGLLEITKRDLTLKAMDGEKEYDGLPLYSQGAKTVEPTSLGSGDRIKSIEIIGSQTLPGKSICSIKQDSIVIMHGDEDVTDCYNITCEDGTLLVYMSITITSGSDQKTYDGTPLTNNSYTVDREMPEDHVLSVTVTGSITNAGVASNTFEYTITDKQGNDVLEFYRVNEVEGRLIVDYRALFYSTGSASKVFDGTPLICEVVRIEFPTATTGLVSGHVLDYELTSITFPGTAENLFDTYTITYNGEDVTNNYQVIAKEIGILEVTSANIKLITGNAEKVYDGTPLTCGDYTVEGELGANNEPNVNITGSIVQVGEAPNTATITILSQTGKDITEGYVITYEFGTLRILENPDLEPEDPDTPNGDFDITNGGISTDGSGKKEEPKPVYEVFTTYDGIVYFKAFNYGEYHIGSDGACTWLAPVKYTGTASVNPLHYPYIANSNLPWHGITLKKIDTSEPYIMPYFTNLSEDKTMNDSMVSTNENEYTLQFIPNTWEYPNYQPLLLTEYSAEELAYRKFVYETYLELPDSTKEGMYKVIRENSLSSDDPDLISKVVELVSNQVNYSYSFHYEGDIAVYFFEQAETGYCQHYATAATALFRALGVPARFATGYTGRVVANEWTQIKTPGHAWVEIYLDGYGWTPVEVTGIPADGEPEDTETPEYYPTKNLIIKPVDVIVEFKDENEVVYAINEVEHGDKEAYADYFEEFMQEGYTYAVLVEGSAKGLPETVVEEKSVITWFELYSPTGEVIFSSDNEPDDNKINVEFREGVIKITPKHIVVELFELNQQYNGKPLSYEPYDYYIASKPDYIETIYFELKGSMTEPGILDLDAIDKSSFVAIDKNGRVLEQDKDYFVVFTGKPLEVLRPKLIIASHDGRFPYDGNEHKVEECTLVQDRLQPGHTLTAKAIGSRTTPGTSLNFISVKITDATGKDITSFYEIDYIFGKLVVY